MRALAAVAAFVMSPSYALGAGWMAIDLASDPTIATHVPVAFLVAGFVASAVTTLGAYLIARRA